MTSALHHILHIKLLRILFCVLPAVLLFGLAKAQPPANIIFRTIDYDTENGIIYGRAPVGSVIKIYNADPASCTRTGDFLASTSVIDINGWVFSGAQYKTGSYVVTMTKDGVETQESLNLEDEEVPVIQPDCAGPASIVLRIPRKGNFIYRWRDQNGSLAGTNSHRIDNVGPGTYTLEYTSPSGCIYRSGPRMVTGVATPESQTITLGCDEFEHLVQGRYDAAIAAEYTFLWEDEDGNQISTTQDKTLGPGTYYFTVISPGGCRSPKATITVKANPAIASIDINNMIIKNANCGQTNGAISGIRVFSANNQIPKYRWTDSKGNVYNSLDISNLAPDTYDLEAYTDGNPCPTYLTNIEIKELNSIILDQSNFFTTPTSCGLNNGTVTNLKSNATGFRWYNRENPETTVSNTIELKDAPPGYYMLELTNNVDCAKEFGPFHIAVGSPGIALTSIPVINEDNCNLGQGSISGVKFNIPVSYVWINEAGEEMVRNADLRNAPAGNYTLTASNDKCQNSFTFTIGNGESVITPPAMEDILICAAANVNISFKETSAIYRIYDAAGKLLVQSSNKDFILRVDQPGVYYGALASGSCESSRTMFRIDFGSSGLQIPTAFSPNGDGVNDKWNIKGIDRYSNPEVKIFNRLGLLVFHSFGPSQPFDGKNKGKDLPVGVYYYIVRASIDCPPASGSLTLVR